MTQLGNLVQAIQAATGTPFRLPAHLFKRIQILLGEAQPVFVDAYAEPNMRTFSGQAVVLTNELVIHAAFDGAGEAEFERTPRASTVTVTAWARSELTQIEIPRDPEVRANLDGDWAADWDTLWPLDAFVSLTYGEHGTLRLPLSRRPSEDNRKALRAFLPNLIADLGTASG